VPLDQRGERGLVPVGGEPVEQEAVGRSAVRLAGGQPGEGVEAGRGGLVGHGSSDPGYPPYSPRPGASVPGDSWLFSRGALFARGYNRCHTGSPPRTEPAMPSSHLLPPSCHRFSALASALDTRSAPRLVCLALRAILVRGRRTVTSWIRAAVLSGEFRPFGRRAALDGSGPKPTSEGRPLPVTLQEVEHCRRAVLLPQARLGFPLMPGEHFRDRGGEVGGVT